MSGMVKRAVLGLSGGIDSGELVAYLAAKGAGFGKRVWCVLMPYKSSSKDSLADAKLVVDDLKTDSMTVEISANGRQSISRNFPIASPLRAWKRDGANQNDYALRSIDGARRAGTGHKQQDPNCCLAMGRYSVILASAIIRSAIYTNRSSRAVLGIWELLRIDHQEIAQRTDLWVGQSDDKPIWGSLMMKLTNC